MSYISFQINTSMPSLLLVMDKWKKAWVLSERSFPDHYSVRIQLTNTDLAAGMQFSFDGQQLFSYYAVKKLYTKCHKKCQTNPVCDWLPCYISATHFSQDAKYHQTRLNSSHSGLFITRPHTTCNSQEIS